MYFWCISQLLKTFDNLIQRNTFIAGNIENFLFAVIVQQSIEHLGYIINIDIITYYRTVSPYFNRFMGQCFFHGSINKTNTFMKILPGSIRIGNSGD